MVGKKKATTNINKHGHPQPQQQPQQRTNNKRRGGGGAASKAQGCRPPKQQRAQKQQQQQQAKQPPPPISSFQCLSADGLFLPTNRTPEQTVRLSDAFGLSSDPVFQPKGRSYNMDLQQYTTRHVWIQALYYGRAVVIEKQQQQEEAGTTRVRCRDPDCPFSVHTQQQQLGRSGGGGSSSSGNNRKSINNNNHRGGGRHCYQLVIDATAHTCSSSSGASDHNPREGNDDALVPPEFLAAFLQRQRSEELLFDDDDDADDDDDDDDAEAVETVRQRLISDYQLDFSSEMLRRALAELDTKSAPPPPPAAAAAAVSRNSTSKHQGSDADADAALMPPSAVHVLTVSDENMSLTSIEDASAAASCTVTGTGTTGPPAGKNCSSSSNNGITTRSSATKKAAEKYWPQITPILRKSNRTSQQQQQEEEEGTISPEPSATGPVETAAATSSPARGESSPQKSSSVEAAATSSPPTAASGTSRGIRKLRVLVEGSVFESMDSERDYSGRPVENDDSYFIGVREYGPWISGAAAAAAATNSNPVEEREQYQDAAARVTGIVIPNRPSIVGLREHYLRLVDEGLCVNVRFGSTKESALAAIEAKLKTLEPYTPRAADEDRPRNRREDDFSANILQKRHNTKEKTEHYNLERERLQDEKDDLKKAIWAKTPAGREQAKRKLEENNRLAELAERPVFFERGVSRTSGSSTRATRSATSPPKKKQKKGREDTCFLCCGNGQQDCFLCLERADLQARREPTPRSRGVGCFFRTNQEVQQRGCDYNDIRAKQELSAMVLSEMKHSIAFLEEFAPPMPSPPSP